MTEKERELRVKRQDILFRYRDDKTLETIDALRELEDLDREYAAAQKAQSPFYRLLTALDNDYSALKSAQGNPARLRAALEAIRDDVRAYEESEGL